MTVYTIPPTVSFVDSLAEGLLARAGNDPLALSAMTVLLPNRRACRNLREAFLRKSAGAPLLLPSIRPIGDVDEDALYLNETSFSVDRVAIDPLRRQIILAQYLNAMDGDRFSMAQALPLAAELGRLLDSIHTEGLTLDKLDAIFPEKYAAHWGEAVKFLKSVLRVFWPRHLEREHAEDPGLYRRHMIEAYTQSLIENPPAGPVFAAGSTGSIPATAALLKTVASLPQGAVVLPGLDTVLDNATWNSAIEEGHPQAGLLRLLISMDVTRADVLPWQPHNETPREALISTLMRPAATLEAWTAHPAPLAAFNDLSLIEADNLDEEAGAIATLMRTHAQDKKATEPCVLVTPDRILATRVAHYLTRWNVAVDDSAGLKLAHTGVGAWLLLLADVLHDGLSPVEFLSALKHPLAAGGTAWPRNTTPFRSFVRQLDLHLLRGPRPAPGFAGLYHRIDHDDHMGESTKRDLRNGLQALEKLFGAAQIRSETSERIRALILLAESLAATPDESGPQRLWAGDAGEAAATMVATILQQADILPPLDWAGCRAVLEAAMEGISVRPRFGTHPRLAILGPIEARLYQAGTMILGGLNEGAWPRLAEVDGWMSRPMRADFGLPAPERAITLSAHDFCQGLGARTVILSRSKNRDGAPTIPSRWLQRLDAVCTAANAPDLRERGAHWITLARALDAPQNLAAPISRPIFNPPIATRPKKLRVTEIAKLRTDPYGIYAKHILGLSPLDPIDTEPDHRERGTLIHAALENYTRAFPKQLPPDALDQLTAIGKQVFADAQAHPDVTGHWWPRFQRMAQALITFEKNWRTGTLDSWAEAEASMTIDTAAGPFTLKGRADRIERRRDGWAVIDYKSGGTPAAGDVKSGDEPQLTLLGAMLLGGYFNEALGIGPVPETLSDLSYWPAGGNRDAFHPADIKGDLNALSLEAKDGLTALVKAYLEDGIPYICWPDTSRKLREDYEYAHLARIAEWSGDTSDEEAA